MIASIKGYYTVVPESGKGDLATYWNGDDKDTMQLYMTRVEAAEEAADYIMGEDSDPNERTSHPYQDVIERAELVDEWWENTICVVVNLHVRE